MGQKRFGNSLIGRSAALVLSVSIALAVVLSGCLPTIKTRSKAQENAAEAPGFSLPDHEGTLHTLAELLADGPAIVVFYRGYW